MNMMLVRGRGSYARSFWPFPTTMRASPTIYGSLNTYDVSDTTVAADARGLTIEALCGDTGAFARHGYGSDVTFDAEL
jgi:hypothetical protein